MGVTKHTLIEMPTDLHLHTKILVKDFAAAMADKLRRAEIKYGYSDGWTSADWQAECRAHLYEHAAKDDPLDVAIYCAFMWENHSNETDPATYTLLKRLRRRIAAL